jgi:hypothetical protein
MKMPLPEPDKLPLKPSELAELATKTQQARELMQETHDAYKRRADKIRAEIASRYNGEAFRAISPAERRRVAEHETAARVTAARKEVLTSMDAIAQHQIGPALAALAASKPLYASPAMSLLRLTVDSDRRARIAGNLGGTGPNELWHAAVGALQSADTEQAAAVAQVVNGMPLAEQPFSAAEFASRFAYPPHENAVNAINSIDRDAQAAILLWRVVQQAKENPVGRIEQAMWEPVLDEADEGAVELPDAVG